MEFVEQSRPGRICSNCGKRIPLSNQHEFCTECLRIKLFPAVKEYVRKNEVTEMEVADHFKIDRALVKEWISEGRLEHKL